MAQHETWPGCCPRKGQAGGADSVFRSPTQWGSCHAATEGAFNAAKRAPRGFASIK